MDMKQLYSSVTDKVSETFNDTKSSLKAGAVGLSLLALAGCAGLTPKPVILTEGMPNTMKHDNQIIYNIDDVWVGHYQSQKFSSTSDVKITQKIDEFIGTKTSGGVFVKKGEQTIRGKLNNTNLFERIEVYWSTSEWLPAIGEIINNGNTIKIYTVDYILEFKRKN